jgi:hypothetical protein
MAGGFDQRKAASRVDDGERQPRETRACADVGDARAAQVGLHAQAVENMFAQHPGAVADGRQVELRVAEFEFVHQLQQRFGAGRIQVDPDVTRARGE